jgi:hypothetical protein
MINIKYSFAKYILSGRHSRENGNRNAIRGLLFSPIERITMPSQAEHDETKCLSIPLCAFSQALAHQKNSGTSFNQFFVLFLFV